MSLLQNSAVIVTGAGAGLGRAYARACADEGAAVVVGDVDLEAAERVAAEIAAGGARAVAVGGSVADWDAAARLVAAALDAFGRLDGLVNNAAIKHLNAPWDETEPLLRRIVEVNVLGTQFCSVHAMRAMQDGGAIVNIVSGAQYGITGMSAYGTTKGAVTAMTAGWALEGAARGIRVNAISPLAQTAMSPVDPGGQPVERPAPEDVAPLVPVLLSPTGTITGAVVRFDGRRLTPYRAAVLDGRYAERDRWSADELAAVLPDLVTDR